MTLRDWWIISMRFSRARFALTVGIFQYSFAAASHRFSSLLCQT